MKGAWDAGPESDELCMLTLLLPHLAALGALEDDSRVEDHEQACSTPTAAWALRASPLLSLSGTCTASHDRNAPQPIEGFQVGLFELDPRRR